MKYYKVMGKITVYHNCNCHHCLESAEKDVNIALVIKTPLDSEEEAIREAALNEAYRELHLINDTDDITWTTGHEVTIREANEDEIMVAMGERIAPRLPGF